MHCVEQTPWGVSEHSETIIAPQAIDNEGKRNIHELTLQHLVHMIVLQLCGFLLYQIIIKCLGLKLLKKLGF